MQPLQLPQQLPQTTVSLLLAIITCAVDHHLRRPVITPGTRVQALFTEQQDDIVDGVGDGELLAAPSLPRCSDSH